RNEKVNLTRPASVFSWNIVLCSSDTIFLVQMTESSTLEPGEIVAEPVAEPAAPAKSRFDRSIVEGPLSSAVWKIAWPTMLTNMIAGLQGMVDHVMVGNLVGYKANAAIGISFQLFLVVIVFISSLFTGMSVLVAR